VLERKIPRNRAKKNISLPINDCHGDNQDRSRSSNKNLGGWSKAKGKNERVWGLKENRRAELEDRTMPAIPAVGIGVRENDLKISCCKSQWRQDYNLKKQADPAVHHRSEEVGTCNWLRSSPKIDSAHRSQQQYGSSVLKEGRHSFWTNPDSVWDEESDAFSLPSPRHDSLYSDSEFESFLSLLS